MNALSPTLLAITVSILFILPATAADKAVRRPNILVIVSDDQGFGDIGVHGCKDIPTPHIDSLATNGIRFRNGYVSGPYCSPTRAGLMTGRYQNRFGHEFNPGPAEAAVETFGLPLSETTLADRLKTAGYVTGMVGKWHLGYKPQFHPQKRGFDEYFGFLGGAHSYVDAKADGANPILRGTERVDEKEYLTDAFRREALAFVERHEKEPWFLYWTFNSVHMPLQATKKYLDRVVGIQDPRRQKYAAMTCAMDDAIGAMLGKLRSLNLEEETLIFFLSDNGGPPANASSNGPLRGHKAQTWEGGIHVPFLIQWKGHLKGGRLFESPVIQLDILPTALAAAGAPVESDWKLDGVNLLPHLTGQAGANPHDVLYWRFGQQMAIRMGDWKLVKAAGLNMAETRRARGDNSLAGAQLFNLRDDLGEQTNLSEKEPDRVKQLADAWKKWNSELVEPKWHPTRPGANRQQASSPIADDDADWLPATVVAAGGK